MMRPDFCAIISLPTAWVVKNVPLRLTSTVQVEIGLGDVLRKVLGAEADIVDQHVDAAERLVRLCNRFAHAGKVGEIHLDGQSAPPEGFDLGRQRFPVGRLADADDHVGAGTRTAQRTGAADAARGAGDQHDLAVQIEPGGCFHGHCLSSLSLTGSCR